MNVAILVKCLVSYGVHVVFLNNLLLLLANTHCVYIKLLEPHVVYQCRPHNDFFCILDSLKE